MLDNSIRLVLPGARTVCYVEREAYAAAVLAARMCDGTLDEAPVWSDLGTFDGRAWHGVVDCVAGGFPCQPSSTAGRRAGADDERWLWPQIQRVLGEVEPAYVFLENVPGILTVSGGAPFGSVLAGLASLGFAAEWCCLPASALGAPQRRNRFWLLAHRDNPACGAQPHLGTPAGQSASRRGDTGGRNGEAVEHVTGNGRREGRAGNDVRGGRDAPAGAGGRGAVGNAHSDGLQGWCVCSPGHEAQRQSGDSGLPGTLFPPGPGDRERWRAILADHPHLAPALSAEEAESFLRDVASGAPGGVDLSRTDQLRALGNLAVPLQAALAFLVLWARIHER